MSGVDSLSVSPNVVPVASGGLDVADCKTNGIAWDGFRWIKVTGAGNIELRLATLRDEYGTETYPMEDGETLPVQFVELVSADPACYPIKVGR